MLEDYHGGNIYEVSRQTGIPLKRIIDFSASVNPLDLPEKAKEVLSEAGRFVRAYPEPWAESLRAVLSRTYDIEEEFILCGAGSSPLLYALASVLRPSSIALFAPTFTEYERAFRAFNTGLQIIEIPLERNRGFVPEQDLVYRAMKKAECIVVCNPNNPTGVTLEREKINSILEHSKDRIVIIDEAFMDFVPGHSVLPSVQRYPGLIVLRSLTKFYGIAGLRVGFMVAHPSMIRKIKKALPPWGLSQLGIELTKAIVQDSQFRQRTLRWLKEEKAFFEEAFKKGNIRCFPSSVNYYLIQTPEAEKIWETLRQKGLLLRRCKDFKGLDDTFLRISLRTRQDNALLLKELSSWESM